METRPIILNIVNAHSWSWALSSGAMLNKLPQYRFLTDARKIGQELSFDIVDFCNLTLVQNVDSIKLVKIGQRSKVVARMGGMLVDDKKNKKDRYFDDLASCGGIIATNRELYNISKEANDNVILCPNGVDLERFKPLEPKPTHEIFTVGFAGNIWGDGIRYKGYKPFMQATIRLYGKIKTLTCLHMHSQIKHEEMTDKFYHKIDCLVLPSCGEGCSNVTGEALACGIPVLTTPVGYHGEMLVDGEECLFITRDPQSIMDAITRLLGDAELQNKLRINGRRFAEEHHNIKQIAKTYDVMFKRMLKRN